MTFSASAGSTVGFGVHNQAFALAPDGSSFTYTNGASTLPIWRSKGTPDLQKPSLLAQTHAGSPTAALALGPGGTWTAEAANTSIYVSRAAAPGEAPPAPITLTGAGAVSHGALAFLGGDGTRLISASGDVLSLWDIAQYSRISTAAAANIPFGCNACNQPDVVLPPNGRTAAGIDGNGAVLDVQDLPPGAVQYSPKAPLLGGQGYAAAQWQSNGSGLIVVSPLDGSAQIFSPTPQGGRIIGTWPPLKVSDPAVLLRSLPDGRRMAEVDKSGTIRFRDAATGKVLRQLNGPKDMARGSLDLHRDEVALDPKADHAAVIDPNALLEPSESKIVVTDTATGHTRTLPAKDALGVAYTANHLLIQRRNGNLEISTASGDRRLGTLQGMTNSDVGPTVGADDFIAEASDNTVRLIDLRSGQALGTLTVPPGIRDTSTGTGLAFSADGTTLVTATEAGAAAIGILIDWKLTPNAWIHTACTSAGRNLTPALWRQYVGTRSPSKLRCTT
jgi:WD40 repeat protein